ncbi:ISL3 family transposase [Chondrinema litorale]|uniref:ISL3 family transposase n=1 Tax=Chondrinema litorale TaxID=2994555 RepID=UPI0025431380|nr:ISL3 family transposase [Chondrinema litorale]UZR96294.1 ISL3 family transposase [Chondrinema litorale]UZR98457.1 ISL3 family transposase [Chondrinema litorale]
MNLLESLLPKVPAIQFEKFTIDTEGKYPVLAIDILRTATTVACPHCGKNSHYIHSYYCRTVQDLSICNFQLKLNLGVRKYYCQNPACRFKIFCERLGPEIQAYQRKTTRVKLEMQAIALKIGANPASQLCQKLFLNVSSSTLLRLMHSKKLQNFSTPRVLGVDDWAFRKGDNYGTILVDLEKNKPIDLLPDRTSETLKNWLEAHPGIEIISRDRSGAYAEAAKQGAPDALQVADRRVSQTGIY